MTYDRIAHEPVARTAISPWRSRQGQSCAAARSVDGSDQMTTVSHGTGDGELIGYRVDLDEQSFLIGEFLGRHADRSQTYRAQSGDRPLVIRIYTREPFQEPRSLVIKIRSEDHIWPYSHVGQAHIVEPASRRVKSAWVAIRRFGSKTLKEALSGGTAPDSYRVALDVVKGLTVLHRNELVHGDLRPSNVVYQSARAKLVDYGLVSDRPRAMLLAEARYLAPETLMRGGGSSPSADMYSFGKLLRYLTMHAPPRAEASRAVLLDVVELCLAVDPAARPNAEEVFNILSAGSESLPRWTAEELSKLNLAVMADLDARLLSGISDHPERFVSKLVRDAIQRVAPEVENAQNFRLANMAGFDMAHFLGSMSLMGDRGARLTRDNRDAWLTHVILKSVEGLNEQLAQSNESIADDGWVDPHWKSEVTEATKTDLEGLGLSAHRVRARVMDQVSGAIDATRAALQSDAFVRSDDVSTIMSPRCPGITADEVRILRDLGYLLGLPVEDAFYYPLFQFDPNSGLPYSCIKEISALAPKGSSTWRTAIWWFLGQPRLGGVSPAEWLRSGASETALVALMGQLVA
jgi:serine/threonine protein kinase